MSEPKKYYEYFYTWNMAEAMRKKHEKNGRKVCDEPIFNGASKYKEWSIWYNREQDTMREPTGNARYYDK